MSQLVENALEFAAHSHRGQVRKYSGEPYILHPMAVAALVKNVGGDEEMQAAALLHDVVEDCEVTIGTVQRLFGPRVAEMVLALSDMQTPADGNRAKRKAAFAARLARSSGVVQTIKLADLIDNTRTIVERDPGFAKVYLAEKRDLLKVLTEGNPVLHELASLMAKE